MHLQPFYAHAFYQIFCHRVSPPEQNHVMSLGYQRLPVSPPKWQFAMSKSSDWPSSLSFKA